MACLEGLTQAMMMSYNSCTNTHMQMYVCPQIDSTEVCRGGKSVEYTYMCLYLCLCMLSCLCLSFPALLALYLSLMSQRGFAQLKLNGRSNMGNSQYKRSLW